MFHTIAPSVLDRSKFMTLNEVARETNHSKLSIVRITPELVLDCRPMESSYVWLGVGIDDRSLHRMPELGLVTEESRQVVCERLQNRYKNWGISLVYKLSVKAGGRLMSLIKHTGGKSWNIPAPELLVSADLDLYVQEAFPIRQKSAKAETVKESVPCLVWDHEAEKLEKLAQGLEQAGYIESADIWCQHFRTSEESALKPTTAPPIKWLKNKKSIQIVLTRNGVTIKKEEWKSHFGTSKPSGFESGEKRDEQLLEIIKEAKK